MALINSIESLRVIIVMLHNHELKTTVCPGKRYRNVSYISATTQDRLWWNLVLSFLNIFTAKWC